METESYIAIDDTVLQRLPDGAFVPRVEGNKDYERFLAWVEAGGVLE